MMVWRFMVIESKVSPFLEAVFRMEFRVLFKLTVNGAMNGE